MGNAALGNITLRKALELAVATEEAGEKYYREMAKKFAGSKEVAEVFNQLALDESGHEMQFKELLGQVPADKEPSEEGAVLLRATSMSEFFAQGKLEDASEIKTPADALAKAMSFERTTLLYYLSLKDVLGESKQLDELIAAEKSHVTSLMRVILSDGKFRSVADPWE
jgi:rubrerythrin